MAIGKALERGNEDDVRSLREDRQERERTPLPVREGVPLLVREALQGGRNTKAGTEARPLTIGKK